VFRDERPVTGLAGFRIMSRLPLNRGKARVNATDGGMLTSPKVFDLQNASSFATATRLLALSTLFAAAGYLLVSALLEPTSSPDDLACRPANVSRN
jgi:hypothetical protein